MTMKGKSGKEEEVLVDDNRNNGLKPGQPCKSSLAAGRSSFQKLLSVIL